MSKLHFTGSFGEYFFVSLGLMILCAFTFGLAFPYYLYWNIKYVVNNTEVV